MTDNSTNMSTDKLISQSESTPSPAATSSSVVTPAVVESDTTPPNATAQVTPTIEEVPQRDTVINPSVVALRAMFPDYDDLVLTSVLESVGGNQDRAIDALLVMSDPEYKGEPPAAVYVQQPALSQTELDEQFARHLMLEEQQQQQQRQQQWVNVNQRPPATYPSQQGGAASESTMGDFQEQFTRIAESGRKTFGTLFSKVKAKIQEFDQGRSTGQSTGSSTQPTWRTYNNASRSQDQAQPVAVTQPSYFDPNSHSSFSSTVSSPPVASVSPPAPTPAVKGYDLSPTPSITPPETPEQLPPSPAIISPAPRSSFSGTPIDAGKFGLLPKRPVSLLRDPAATGSPPAVPLHSHPTEDDDDGLEYTENPFEEPEQKR